MLRASILFSALMLACSEHGAIVASRASPDAAAFRIRESFSEATLSPEWVASVPSVPGAEVRLEPEGVHLLMVKGSENDLVVRRTFDVSPVRGKRIKLVAHVRTDAPRPSVARAALVIATVDALPSYVDSSSTSEVNSASQIELRAVVDVSRRATSGEIQLVLRGAGSAWFQDVSVIELGASPPAGPIRLSDR